MSVVPKFEVAARSRIDAAIAAKQGAADVKPRPLPSELLPVEPLPMAALPEAFRPWVTDVATRMHCPPDFVAVPLIVAAASLVARHVTIRPQQRTDWCERGNLWALIVGRPGLMKSPAMSAALAPIERLEARAAEAHAAALADHTREKLACDLRAEARVKAARAALKRDARADVAGLLASDESYADAPTRQRYIVADATYEKLGELLADNPGGVLSVRDEMRGLFLHLAREESAPARAFYLQAWSGGRYVFDRIGRGTVTVEDARLSMIGGIQPGPLAELVRLARRGAADDGMLERFLVAWPDAPGTWCEVDRHPDGTARRAVWAAFERLDAIVASGNVPGSLCAEVDIGFDGEPKGLPYLRFADDAREAFGEWRSDLETKLRTAEVDGIEGALSKYRHHVPALALALHVIDGGTGPVSLAAAARALALAEYFESHTRRLHASGRREAVRGARAIVARARAGDLPDPFGARDIYRNQWAGLADRAVVADALDTLVAHGWLTETAIPSGADGGRPTTVYSLTTGARNEQVA
jgi:putative DNA primase/helicase